MTVTSAKYTNADQTIVTAVIDGVEWRNIREGSQFWPQVHGEGITITPYAPPPVDLVAYAANKRFEIETGGIVVNGAHIQTDRDSQGMITGAVVYLNNNPDATSADYKAESGWVTLDKATMLGIGIAVGAHVQACFSAEKAVDADIAAGTITAAAQIDGDGRWPANG